MSLEILKDNLKKGTLNKVYLFWGPEDYLIKYYQEEIKSKLIDPAFKSFNYKILEGKESIKEIIRNCETPPAFSGKKMIVVKNSCAFVSETKGKKPKDTQSTVNELAGYFEKIPEDVCVLFIEEQANKNTIMYETIKKNGLCVIFDYQRMPELSKWVGRVFSTYNVKIDKYEAEYLVSLCNPGMNDILNEVKKLIDAVGVNNKVTKEHIDSLCIKSIQGKVFEMIDSITQGNPAKAYDMLNDMISLKEPLQKISVLTARQFKNIYLIKQMIGKGYNADKISVEMKLSPYIASKYIKSCKRYEAEKLREAVKDSLEMDRRVKTGRIDSRIAFETFIANYSA